MDGHFQQPGKKRRQRQRALGRARAIERGHDSLNWLRGHRMVAAAKKQRRGGSVPGDPVGDTAKQQAAATAGALGRHDDQIGVGRVVDDPFRGTPVSDSSLDRATRRTEPRRDLLEIPRRRLTVWMLLRADAEQPNALRGKGGRPTQRDLGAFRTVQRNQDAIEPGHGAVPSAPEDVRSRMTGTRDSRSSFSATLPSTQRELL